MTKITARIENDFKYHPPVGNKGAKHEELRFRCLALAHWVDNNVPDSREKSTALTYLETAMMWGNAGIARNEETPVTEPASPVQV